MQRHNCSAVVLSGGRGSRMGGCNKSALTMDGERFLDRMQRELLGFGELILSANDPAMAAGTAFVPVADRVPGQGPMGGVFSALSAANFPCAFVTACDMPFFSGSLADILLNEYAGEDALVCRSADGKLHPLCGIYSKSCLPALEQSVAEGRLKLSRLLETLDCRIFPVPEEYGWRLTNVNTPEDLRRARSLKK